jgi:hypothetical protein
MNKHKKKPTGYTISSLFKLIIFNILPFQSLNDFFFTNDNHHIVSQEGWRKIYELKN